MFDNYFKNKKVVIIGASGSLGRVYTRAFHQVGARLFLLGRDIDKLKMFVQEFSSFIPISSVDITNEDSLKNVVSEIKEWSECIDIVINATGFDVRKSLSAHSLEASPPAPAHFQPANRLADHLLSQHCAGTVSSSSPRPHQSQ